MEEIIKLILKRRKRERERENNELVCSILLLLLNLGILIFNKRQNLLLSSNSPVNFTLLFLRLPHRGSTKSDISGSGTLTPRNKNQLQKKTSTKLQSTVTKLAKTKRAAKPRFPQQVKF